MAKKHEDIQESAISGSADRPNIFSKYWRKEPMSECKDLVEMMSLLRKALKFLGVTLLISW
jgi:hypothetical protein